MKRKLIPLFLVVVLLSTHAPVVPAQQLSDWSSVQQLKTNERLVVKQRNGKEASSEYLLSHPVRG